MNNLMTEYGSACPSCNQWIVFCFTHQKTEHNRIVHKTKLLVCKCGTREMCPECEE